MADTSTSSKVQHANRGARALGIGIIVLGFVLFEVYHRLPVGAFGEGAGYPLCDDTKQGVEMSFGHPNQQLQLHPNCWSGVVTMPDEPFNFRVNNGPKAELEYRFADGQRVLFPATGVPTDQHRMGDIASSSFRLRGEGIAKITVEPR